MPLRLPQRQPHPWLAYLPPHQRRAARRQRRWLQLRAWLGVRRHQVQLLLAAYLLFALLPLALGLVTLSGFAILPLLLVPPVGYLIYWLVWKEFHH